MPEEKKATPRSRAKSTTARKSSNAKGATSKSKTQGTTPIVAANPEAESRELIRKTIATQQGKVDTYNALKEQGLPIPADLKAEVEEAQPKNADHEQYYVRNLNHTMFRFKLSKHTPQQRGIVLQARGTRGDLSPLEEVDLKDNNLRTNANLGYVEIITHAEAQGVVDKQTVNQQAVHPALASLRNEKGEAYGEDAFSVGPSPDEQAITVAKLDDGQVAFDRTGIRGRVRGESPGTPDYVGGAEPTHSPANEEASYLSDQRARQRGHNPADGLKVSVEPSVRTGGNPGIVSDGFNPEK